MNWNITARNFCDEIQRGIVFSFSRWGDGEWTALLGRRSPKNCDGHPYSNELTEALRAALQTDGIRFGISSQAQNMYGERAKSLLSELQVSPDWYDANIFHTEEWIAHQEQRRSATLDLFRSRVGFSSSIVVGPDCYSKLNDVFPVDAFIEIPRQNCFSDVDRIADELEKEVQSLPKPVLVSISASMATNVIVSRLYPELAGIAWLLDLGSMWLPYIPGHGLRLRSGQRRKVPVT